MKYPFFFFLALLLLCSCAQKPELTKDLDCSVTFNNELEEVKDLNQVFSIEIPKNWKTNIYKDEVQSSIFSADTTKQLTKSFLIDVSAVQKNIELNDFFILKQEQENLKDKLIRTSSNFLIFEKMPALHNVFIGKKRELNYQKHLVHIKLNEQNFLVAKIEIYGTDFVKERVCEALTLLETIKIQRYQ